MKVICFYHKVDLDGKCSAAIVKRKYPDAECIGVDYHDKPNIREIEDAGMVIIVDFSFQGTDMEALLEFFGYANVIWIDHHKSAIENSINYILEDERGTSLNQVLEGKREIGKAACALTWEYFFPDEPMPAAIELMGYYHMQSKGLNN